jgi:hypothetical protein
MGYSRLRFLLLARRVVREIEDYVRSGFRVEKIVAIGGSPTCGAFTTLDVSSAVDCIARCPVAYLDRATYNRDAIAANVVPGRGTFMQALMSGLRRRHLVIPVEEHDLLAEMRERGVGS